MLAQENLYPSLRFKGFDDNWQKQTIGNCGTFYYGHSAPKWSISPDAKTPCVRYGELYTKFGNKIDKIFSYTSIPIDNLVFSKGTEVLIPRVGEDPWDYNHCTWLSLKNVAIGEMISVYNTKHDPLFTATMFNARLRHEFAKRVEGGSVTNLYYDKLKDIEVFFPNNHKEELKISQFFSNIDERISLQQKRIEQLTNIKKSVVQKMFPANGANVPEIRFKGFIDNWEQHNLGEYVNITTGKLDANAMVPDGKYDFYTSGIQKYKIDIPAFKGPAITIAGNGATVGYMHFADGEFNAYQRTYVLTEFKTNREYLYFQIGQKLPKKIASEARTGSIPYIVLDMLTDLKIFKPTETECEKLGSFFSKIDNLIDFHKYKLEKLKNLKKACLDDMFV